MAEISGGLALLRHHRGRRYMIRIRGSPKDAHGGAENERFPDLSLAMMAMAMGLR